MIPFRDNLPSRAFPLTTVTIIVINVVVFLYEITLTSQQLENVVTLNGLVPARVDSLAEQPLVMVTSTGKSLLFSMFLHAGWMHLIGNMLYLWVFGDNVEDRMGHFRFLVFYLSCGFLAGLTHLFFNWGSTLPSIGASGAVAGVLGAYMVSYPFARVATLIPLFLIWPVVELPALLVLGSWFLVQVLNSGGLVGGVAQSGGIAWWAHIGGFFAGLMLISVFARPCVRRYSWEA